MCNLKLNCKNQYEALDMYDKWISISITHDVIALMKNNSYNIADYMFISDHGAGAECSVKVIFFFAAYFWRCFNRISVTVFKVTIFVEVDEIKPLNAKWAKIQIDV